MRSMWLTLLFSAAFAQWGEEDPFDRDEKWCGDDNCYDILNVTNTMKRSQIKKRYRELSTTMHPDKFTDPAEKKVKEEEFKKIARANEILSSNKKRKQYDKYLAMKNSMDSPKESPIVVLILMSVVTFVIVHLWKTQLYEKDRRAITSHKVIENWINDNSTVKRSDTSKSRRKKSIKERRKGRSTEDDEFKYSDEDITAALKATDFYWPGWTGGKPTYVDSLKGTILLPFLFVQLTFTNVRWLILYGILRSDYSDADCAYLCYTEADIGAEGWAMLTPAEKIERLNNKEKPYYKKSLIAQLRSQTPEGKAAAEQAENKKES